MHPNSRQVRGFTLIEVLIAVLILSIGLLSLALTQAKSIRHTQSAYLRSQATILAGDIIDSIRANRGNGVSSAYDIALGASGTSGAPPGETSVAEQDLVTWKNNLAALLPQGDGSIVRAGNEFTVTVQWLDRDDSTTVFAVTTIP